MSGRKLRLLWLCSALLAPLAATSTPTDGEAAETLLRIAWLEQWLGGPAPELELELELEEGLCIQQRYALSWPQPGRPPSERQAEALRQAREQCAALAGDADLRLISEARAAFQSRLQRLQASRQQLADCAGLADAGRRQNCQQQTAGRNLSEAELRWLRRSSAGESRH